LQIIFQSLKVKCNIPIWLVANNISMLSWESLEGDDRTPALLLQTEKESITVCKKARCCLWIWIVLRT